MPRTRIERVAAEQSPITIDTALRLSRFFGGTAKFWINLQTSYDLEMAARAGAAADLSKIKPYAAPSAA